MVEDDPRFSIPSGERAIFPLLALPGDGIGDHVLQPAQGPQAGKRFLALGEHLRGRHPAVAFGFIHGLQLRLDSHPAMPQFRRQRQMQAAVGVRFENRGDGTPGDRVGNFVFLRSKAHACPAYVASRNSRTSPGRRVLPYWTMSSGAIAEFSGSGCASSPYSSNHGMPASS